MTLLGSTAEFLQMASKADRIRALISLVDSEYQSSKEIIDLLNWQLEFISYFDSHFLHLGEYKKPNLLKQRAAIRELLELGMRLKLT